MKWQPGMSRWIQIADDLEWRIRAGEYQPGERIPSVVDLEVKYGVASATAHKALKALRQRGLAEVFPGLGYYAKCAT